MMMIRFVVIMEEKEGRMFPSVCCCFSVVDSWGKHEKHGWLMVVVPTVAVFFLHLCCALLLSPFFIPHLHLVYHLSKAAWWRLAEEGESLQLWFVVAEMQHSCHGLNDLKTFDILRSWQYGATLTDEGGFCLDLTPCNIYHIMMMIVIILNLLIDVTVLPFELLSAKTIGN